MVLKNIHLSNFRNFESRSFDFDKNLTIIVGENSRGKTNLLESVYFICNGTGFRESREDELLFFRKDTASAEGHFDVNQSQISLKISLQKVNDGVKKVFLTNKAIKNYFNYRQDSANTVLFSPQQISIITGSPDERRSYFNRIISKFDIDYKRKLINYENAIRKRNKILEIHKNNIEDELQFWNEYLIEQGSYITHKRTEYIHYLNNYPQMQEKVFKIEYQKNEITSQRLETSRDEERKYRKTMIGPQKDDFQIYIEPHQSVHAYGSRSQQRLAIFWLLLNELRYFQQQLNIKPILLLDDVFSELDIHNRELILDLINEYQTVITTTEAEMLQDISVNFSIIKI